MTDKDTIAALRVLLKLTATFYSGETTRSLSDIRRSLTESINVSIANPDTPITPDQQRVLEAALTEIGYLPD